MIVYQATNLINGKRYIGVTGRRLILRKREHDAAARQGQNEGAFHRAIRKYGVGSFWFRVLKTCATRDEVMAEEIRLIAALHPEYNSTKGGDGQLGRVASSEARAKMGAANRGNKYRLGKRHTLETRTKLRASALRHCKEWLARRHTGPSASSRPVLCVTDGRHFPSASAAARECGVAKSALIELCLGKNGRKTVSGFIFKYQE